MKKNNKIMISWIIYICALFTTAIIIPFPYSLIGTGSIVAGYISGLIDGDTA